MCAACTDQPGRCLGERDAGTVAGQEVEAVRRKVLKYVGACIANDMKSTRIASAPKLAFLV